MPPATITDTILAALEPHRNKQHGPNRYNTPWREGADGGTLSVERDEAYGLGLKWYDHKDDSKGNGYTLAKHLGIEIDTGKVKFVSKPVYKSLAEYAQAHGIDAETLELAGWYETQRVLRGKRHLVFAFQTENGERYRYADEGASGRKYDHVPGYHPCWYGLERAVALAESRDAPLVFCNGEVSTIAAQYHGIPAFCVTGGERSSVAAELVKVLKQAWGGSVLIALDCDDKGRSATRGLLVQLIAAGIDTKPVDLGGSYGFDLSDFCMLYGADSMPALLKRIVPDEPQPPPRTAPAENDPTMPHGISTLVNHVPEPIIWYAPGFLREGLGLLAGLPQIGKTPLLLQLGLSLAAGVKWLNTVPCVKSRVLYLGVEYSKEELYPVLVESAQAMRLKLGVDITDRDFAYKTVEDNFPTTPDEAIAELDFYFTIGYDVIIIDTMTAFLPPEKFKQSVYRGDYKELQPYHQLCQRHHKAALGAWHASKREADPRRMYNGSVGLWAAPASRMTMYEDQDQRIRISSFPRLSDRRDWALAQERSMLGRRWIVVDADPDPICSPTELTIYRWLKVNSDKANPKTPATVAEMLGVPAHSTRTILSRMFDKNIIQRTNSGHAYYVESVSPVADSADVADVASVADVALCEIEEQSATRVALVLRDEPHQDAEKQGATSATRFFATQDATYKNGSHPPVDERAQALDARYDAQRAEQAQRYLDSGRYAKAGEEVGKMRSAALRKEWQAKVLEAQQGRTT